jgi:tRNA-dihydrouridine synthase B
MIAGHYEDMLSFYGRILGPRVARKHLGWYMDGAGTPPGLRKAILTEADPRRVMRLLSDAIGPDAGAAAA